MGQEAILYPVFVLVALTFGMAIWMARLRFRAASRGDLNPRYFELNRGGKVPEDLAKVSNNYHNLLELPLLFYVLVMLLYVTKNVEPVQIVLAWLFVAARCIHSYIHTTFNRVLYRARMFMVGSTFLAIMWLLFMVRVVPGKLAVHA